MIRLIAALLLAATPAIANDPCGAHDDMVKGLKQQYGETVQSMGMSQTGPMVELFANAKTGTWSMLVTVPDGNACLVAAGTQYQTIKPGDPA